ncbi:mycofactocin-associated electron transfer flavoprotein beta subunit [Pseudonocardia acidicola]|uniref:Mycofactocin-associated electron transfer flavoprotein n=1 Tax=Pseudonocardia acidicola TaxID=2724939 RepID=A0ABX1SCI8_9PSEU|nr:mycofactocin-associated electron transfer flavoprotein beta subunit [Pseudonocardia acidicola]NMH98071.1 putative mycofactocin-associated electron transfer flavoprotein [Pseudonocardia acidicola]
MAESGPLIVAALRFVDDRAHVDPLTGHVRIDPRGAGPSEADRTALEYALRLAAETGGRAAAVTAGPPAADAMLRDALAVGADAVLRVGLDVDDPLAAAADDGAGIARALADAITAAFGPPQLVLCGDHSADRGTGSTPAHLAEELGVVQALGLLELERSEEGLRAVRRLDGGRRERILVPLPAVCSVEPTAVRLRRASLPATLAARGAQIPVADLTVGHDGRVQFGAPRAYRPRPRVLPAPEGAGPRQRLLALTGALVERTPPRVVRPGSPAQAADELLGYLRQHGYLDVPDAPAR